MAASSPAITQSPKDLILRFKRLQAPSSMPTEAALEAATSQELDHLLIGWGKHRSLTYKEAYDSDPAWVAWTLTHMTSPNLSQKIFIHYVSLRVTEEEARLNLEPIATKTPSHQEPKAKAAAKTTAKAKARPASATVQETSNGEIDEETEFEMLSENHQSALEHRMIQMEATMAQMFQFMNQLAIQQAGGTP